MIMTDTEAITIKRAENPVPIVRINQLTKRFGTGPTVLEDVSIKAYKGEFVSLVGPSGCGKSTLLKLISGLLSPTEGDVVIDGMKPRDAREEMAFIFQDPNLLPWKRVLGNAELPLLLRGTAKMQRRERAQKMLELVGLTEAAAKFPWQLSGGMRMRVSIARALTLSPRVLLLDEPFGALDEMTRDQLNEDLLSIYNRDRWTAFFVTHSVAEAVFLSTRILVLSANPGRVAHDITIDLPAERDATLRESRSYLDQVANLSRLLRSVQQ